jgi:hypothetical protein
VKNATAWARGEIYEMISNNMVLKLINRSYIARDVNKKYPIRSQHILMNPAFSRMDPFY